MSSAVDQSLAPAEAAGWLAYQRGQARLAAVLTRELTEATGLSEADFEVLSALSAADGGRARSMELRCTMQWEKSRLSHQLRRMEQRGLVQRATCCDDARGADVLLTDAGRIAAREASCARARSVRTHVIEPLGHERLAQLAAIATDIDDGIRATLEASPECQAARTAEAADAAQTA